MAFVTESLRTTAEMTSATSCATVPFPGQATTAKLSEVHSFISVIHFYSLSINFDIRNSCSIALTSVANSKHSIVQRLAMSSALPHSSRPQRLRFGEFLVDIVRFVN